MNCLTTKLNNYGSLGFAVVVAPAVALLGGGSTTAAKTGGASRQIPMNLNSLMRVIILNGEHLQM